MSAPTTVYRCAVCGNTVELLARGGGTLSCCGQPMLAQVENTVEASQEKHIPVLARIPGGWKVTVGSVLHPMVEAHSILWIELQDGDRVQRVRLHPGQAPEATFACDAEQVVARAYCNLHGFWKSA